MQLAQKVTPNSFSQPAIEIEHLWAGYDRRPILEDVTLEVKPLDFIALSGPNGGGKTTLLKVLLGLLQPMQGEVRILGRSAKQGRRYIGYVPQTVECDRDFPIRVWDVVRMGRLAKRPLLHPYNRQDDRIVAECLQQVDLFDRRDRPFGTLSGGQRQRVYVARALATQPHILLLDEPTASVDDRGRMKIYRLLQQLNESVTILTISHDLEEIAPYVKTMGYLNRRLFYDPKPIQDPIASSVRDANIQERTEP